MSSSASTEHAGGADGSAALNASRVDTALLLARLALAAVFLFHGSQILFGAFGGPGLAGFVGFTHLPMAVAVLVGIGQFGGGLSMLLGLFSRIGALGIMVVMAGAFILVHLKNGFSIGNPTGPGYEYVLVLFLIALAVVIAGPGAFSLAAKSPEAIRKL